MNKNTLITIAVLGGLGLLGFYLYQKSKRTAVTQPGTGSAPVTDNGGGIIDEAQDLWDSIFGKG